MAFRHNVQFKVKEKDNRQQSSSNEEKTCTTSLRAVIPTCTSMWNSDHLNLLQITTVLSKAYTALDIVNSFKMFRLRFEDEVIIDNRVKRIIDHLNSHMPSGLRVIDFSNISSVPYKTAASVLYDANDGSWNEKSFFISPLPGPPDAKDEYWCESFRVSGDLFSKRLMYITWLRDQDLPVSEHLFQELFQHFTAMFGLNAIGAPGVKYETVRIGDVEVKSTADLVYYDFPNCSQDQGSQIFVVCKVTKDDLQNDEEPSRPKICRYLEENQQEIALSSNLIGQHGGELLTHFPFKSSVQYGLFGFIVQCTSVTFTHFDCSEIDFEQIKSGNLSFPEGSRPTIRFSKPYNILKAEDRNEIIAPLLKLGFIKSYI